MPVPKTERNQALFMSEPLTSIVYSLIINYKKLGKILILQRSFLNFNSIAMSTTPRKR
jgi:hypothetical protein